MKNLLYLIFLLPLSLFGQSAVTISAPTTSTAIFVSNSGSSGNDGLTVGTAITPSQLNVIIGTLKSGTRILFNRGEVFSNEFALPTGGSPNSRIIFDAYGNGANPVITGSDYAGGLTWTSEGGGIYSTPQTSAPKWVFVAGAEAPIAQTDWIVTTSKPSSTQFGASTATLNAFASSLVGAGFIVKEFNFRLSYPTTINAYNSGTGVLTVASSSIVGAAVNSPFKLTGQVQFIDQVGEWAWDATAQKLYIKTSGSSPAGTDIRFGNRDYGISLAGGVTDVTIQNITFRNQYRAAVYGATGNDRLSILDCSIKNVRTNGIYLRGGSRNVQILRDSVTRCGLNGISLGALKTPTISNNYLANIGTEATIGIPLDTDWLKSGGCGIAFAWDASVSLSIPEDATISFNTISTLGFCGILTMGRRHAISYNKIDSYCKRWLDGGGIYTIHRAALGAGTDNIKIQKNICFSGQSTGGEGYVAGQEGSLLVAGIYLDENSRLCTVDNNVCYGNYQFGIYANFGANTNTYTNNYCYNNSLAQMMFVDNTSAAESGTANTGNVAKGNVMVNLSANQYGMIFASGSTSYTPFTGGIGTLDLNYYISPYTTNVAGFQTSTITATPSTNYTLAAWKTKTGDEANARSIANTLTYISSSQAQSDIPLSVNSDLFERTEVAKVGSVDIDNLTVSRVRVPAFSGVATIKAATLTPIFLDNFTDANGTNITAHTPDLGSAWVIGSAGGAFSITSNALTCSTTGNISTNTTASDVTITTVGTIVTSGTALNVLLRYVDDSNYTLLQVVHNAGSSAGINVISRTGGTSTTVKTGSATMTLSTGTPITVQVSISGSSTLSVYINSVLQTSVSVNTYSFANTTATKHGLRLGASSQTIDSYKIEQ